MQIKCLVVGSISTNCYLLVDESTNAAAVIDPGGSAGAILAAIEADGLRVEKILLTHGHFDHTGAVGALLAACPGAAGYLHPADLGMDDPRLFPLPAQAGRGELPAGIRTYGEGDALAVGSLTVEVLHTPGHTPGSVCLRCGEVLFSGDTLFAGSAGRTDLPGGSEREMAASLRRLAALPGDCTVCPGHGEGSTLKRERQFNPYLRMAVDG